MGGRLEPRDKGKALAWSLEGGRYREGPGVHSELQPPPSPLCSAHTFHLGWLEQRVSPTLPEERPFPSPPQEILKALTGCRLQR